MTRLQYSARARKDLDDIWFYHASRGEISVADTLIERIARTIGRTILAAPKAGRIRLELGEDVRSFPVVPYVVFYRIEKNSVEIIRILHGHRNIRPPLISLLIAI